MSASNQTPTAPSTARLRKSRTRTPKVNSRPPIAVSGLKLHQYDLRPYCASLICPDCKTCVPITGVQANVSKLVPHHAGTAGKDAPVRCSGGSNRRVVIDVPYEVWQRRLHEGGAETTGRRATSVRRKPRAEIAPPVARMKAQPMTAADALVAYRQHLKACRESGVDGRCGVTYRCTEGAVLARRYARMQQGEPQREEARAELAATRAKIEARYQREMARLAREEWRSQAERRSTPVRLAKRCAKPSGTEVEELNNVARSIPGSISDRGRPVPLKPARVTTR